MTQRGLAQFEQFGGVARQPVLPLEVCFLVGAELCGGDFTDLMAKKVELPRVSFFVHDQRRFFSFPRGALSDEFRKLFPQGIETSERIKNRQLSGGMEERL